MPQSKIRRYLKHGTLTQLSVFEAVARLGNYTRAAEELYLAQPTVSVQIKKLTETVGVQLLEQIGKSVHLTEAGRELHRACHEIFQQLIDVEDRLADIRGLKSGRLRLAVSTTGKYFAPRLLAAFVHEHPGIEVSLQIHHRETLIERMAANADDLYIFANPPTTKEVVTQAILPNPMTVFARADHPLAGERRIPFSRFAEEPFLMREPGSGTRMVAQQVFARHGIAPKVRMELSTNEAIKQAVLAGLGVSIMSRYTLGLDTEQNDLATLDVEGFPLEGQWYLVYPAGKQPSAVTEAFMAFARKEAKELVLDHLRQLRTTSREPEPTIAP
ncbi:MAG: LysR family transcriptional regulator [Betaproteobacteria bacterium]|nr:MAG: LysR family transcriptional regulator [Betaproteobacteria bacterium]